MDFIVRKKIALTMSFTLVDSLPLPRVFNDSSTERLIASNALRLASTGPEMSDFWDATASQLGLGSKIDAPAENAEERDSLRAEIDVVVARDLFGLTLDEMRFLLDPTDVLGADCNFETFGALKRAEEKAFDGHFRTRDLILRTWDRLPIPHQAQAALVKQA